MTIKSNRSEKLWIGFGIVTIISGIILAFEQPVIGISGSVVGIWLVAMNWKQMRNGKNE